MEISESRSSGERRITLLTRLAQGGATIDDIARMPVYESDAKPASLRRTIERDIQALRESGHHIIVDDRPDGYFYRLDDSSNIPVSGASLDLTLLRQLLASKSTNAAELFAQSGIQKLLAEGETAPRRVPYHLRVPDGEAVTAIAPAVQQGVRVRFTYDSVSRGGPARYIVEPWQLDIHFDAFYLRAWQVSVDGTPEPGARTFKLSRIVGDVELTDTPIHEEPQMIEDQFAPVDARVEIAPGTCAPLAARASDVRSDADRTVLEFVGVDRSDLYEDLVLYGSDARLVGPEDVLVDFTGRLAHIVEVARHG